MLETAQENICLYTERREVVELAALMP